MEQWEEHGKTMSRMVEASEPCLEAARHLYDALLMASRGRCKASARAAIEHYRDLTCRIDLLEDMQHEGKL